MGVLDNGRTWNCTVTVYDLHFGDPDYDNSITSNSVTTYTNANIKSWKITDTMSANGDVAFGSTGSKALNLELIGLSSKAFGTGAIITVALGGAATKTWAFFVDTVAWNTEYGTTTRYSASVTAYDAMYYANGKIQGVLKYSRISQSIKEKIESGSASVTDCKTIAQYCIRHARYDLIRTRAAELYTETGLAKYDTYANMLDSTADDGYSGGKTMDNVCDDDTGKVTIGTYSGYSGNLSISGTLTARTLLGRMAAMAGKRAYCNNYSIYNVGTIDFGNLITGTYTTVTTSDVYENGFVSEGKKKFTYFTTGKEDYGKKTSNSFSTMSINCPDMTSSKLASIASAFMLGDNEYEIGSVKFRGDPNLTSGMRLNAPDASGTTHDMICTKVITNYDGGLYQQLYSEGKSDSDIEFENNAYAENAEQIVDEGGGEGGGGGSYQFYHETTSPNSATIAVDNNSIVTNADGITVTGNIFADSIGNKSANSTSGAKLMFGDLGGHNMTYMSTIMLAYDSTNTQYENTTLDWANADKLVTHNGGQTQHYYNELFIDKLDVGIDKGGSLSEINGNYGGIRCVGDVQIGGQFGIQTTTGNLSVTGDTTLNGDISLPANITNISGGYLRVGATTKLDIAAQTEITGDFKVYNQYSASDNNGIVVDDTKVMLHQNLTDIGIDSNGMIWTTPGITMTYEGHFTTVGDGVFIDFNNSLFTLYDISSGATFNIDFLARQAYFS